MYNPNWRNHPNFSWRNETNANQVPILPNPTTQGDNFVPTNQGVLYTPPRSQSQNRSLEDLLTNFIQIQKSINQSNQQTFQDFQKELRASVYQIIIPFKLGRKRGFPTQPQPKLKGQYEVATQVPLPHGSRFRS